MPASMTSTPRWTGRPTGRHRDEAGPRISQPTARSPPGRSGPGRDDRATEPQSHHLGGQLGYQRLARGRVPCEQDTQGQFGQRKLEQEEQCVPSRDNQGRLQREHQGRNGQQTMETSGCPHQPLKPKPKTQLTGSREWHHQVAAYVYRNDRTKPVGTSTKRIPRITRGTMTAVTTIAAKVSIIPSIDPDQGADPAADCAKLVPHCLRPARTVIAQAMLQKPDPMLRAERS
jgi:hypothetical protein